MHSLVSGFTRPTVLDLISFGINVNKLCLLGSQGFASVMEFFRGEIAVQIKTHGFVPQARDITLEPGLLAQHSHDVRREDGVDVGTIVVG